MPLEESAGRGNRDGIEKAKTNGAYRGGIRPIDRGGEGGRGSTDSREGFGLSEDRRREYGHTYRMGSAFRKLVGVLFTGFVLVILAGIASEFLNGLAREKGWYDNPSQKWDASIAAFRQFVTRTWFLCAASALGGLTIGLWLDRLFRRREVIETPPSPDAIAQAMVQRRELAKTLDDLHAEGVRLRDLHRLAPKSVDIANITNRMDPLIDWDAKVLLALDNDIITVRQRSNFRSLDRFTPITRSSRSIVEQQQEAIWDEKLERLRRIIDLVGN